VTSHFEILAILASAVLVVWIFRQLKLPAILAYLVAGMLVGEHGLAIAADHVNYEQFAELGIVFLLFTLGLEFSLPKLLAMRRLVLAVGGLQVVVTMLIFGLFAFFIGQTVASSLIIGGILALSSTAIVIRQLTESGGIKRKSGQISVAVLLFQDVAVVPLLIIMPLLAQSDQSSLLNALLLALFKGVVVVLLLLLSGKWLLPSLFNAIARVKTSELFVLTTLLVTLLASTLTLWFGLSMALGAFLAGMMLGESQYKHQLEADIRPFRDILLGLFFITVGMKLDIQILAAAPFTILSVLLGFMLLKVLITVFLVLRFGESLKDALASALMLAQMGEFGFVLIALANQLQLIPLQTASVLLVAGVISMAITPYIVANARAWSIAICKEQFTAADLDSQKALTENLANHVVICGFGRVGQTVSRFLKKEKIEFVAIDLDPLRVGESLEAGEKVLFGSSRQREILQAAHVERARLVVVAFGDDKHSIEVIQKVRSLNAEVQILVRTRTDDQLVNLQKAGANEVVPESLEGSLMLVSQVLSLSGVPFARIIKRVQRERKNHYNQMHGFYQGEKTNLSPDVIEHIEFSHAILLNDDAYAVGKTLAELKLLERRVEITCIKHETGGEVDSPGIGEVLQVGDTLILRGKPRRVERAERFLYEGS
jgi:monovalent cation:H+ antiporter-2, CPA2 family